MSGFQVTGFDHLVPVNRICGVMSSRKIESHPDVTTQILFQGMPHITLSTDYDDIDFVARDEMLQACCAEDA